jgi:acetyl esterase/lipase
MYGPMRSLCLAVLLAFAGGAAAQVPKEAAARIKEIGPVLNPEMIGEMMKLYAPLMPKAPAGVTVKEDIAYGADERQKLDVFVPEKGTGRALPVVIFVHGGGYVGGGKSRAGIPFYQNVGYFFARNRVVGVNMTYRLAPKNPWPAGGEDVAAAVRWVHKNAAEYGGDPERIVLFGQSAGATHVAHYIFDESLQPKDRADGVKGAILQSGIFDPAAAPPGPNVEAYFGKERESWHAKSLYGKLAGRVIPLFLIDAEYDPPPFKEETAKLRNELCKRRGCPRTTELAGHNHLSEILHLNSADDSMGSDILGFIRFPR